MTRTVAVLVGSLRSQSINHTVAKALAKVAEGRLVFDFVEIGDLPLYNDDLWHDGRGPEPVERMRAQIAAADGVLLVTPEYNRTVPGVLVNALDWGSRPWGQSVWVNKPAGCCGAATGAIGTAAAVPGTLVNLAAGGGERQAVRFGHPSGTLRVGAEAKQIDGNWTVTKAIMSRSARVLMEGSVRVPADTL